MQSRRRSGPRAPTATVARGVVWHTQGSGKSLTMAFYAGKLVVHPALANPTVVVLSDRNDLDDQLYGVFSRCSDLIRQRPVQARDRAHLRELLQVASGGVVFTTIQKFVPDEKGDTFPTLTERRNVVVIADEAHRSQYDFIDVFAAAGLQKPDISLLSDEFLAEVRELPQRNLAVELLRKLLNDEVKARTKRNVVQGRAFSELLEATIPATETGRSRPLR